MHGALNAAAQPKNTSSLQNETGPMKLQTGQRTPITPTGLERVLFLSNIIESDVKT